MALDPINFDKDNRKIKRDKDLQLAREVRVRKFRKYPKLRKVELWQSWLQLRRDTADEDGEKLCYCRHTFHCICGDPSFNDFCSAVSNGNIILDDPKNGWS